MKIEKKDLDTENNIGRVIMTKKINLYNEKVYAIIDFLEEQEKIELLNFIQRHTESD
jgi:hypothetical protein